MERRVAVDQEEPTHDVFAGTPPVLGERRRPSLGEQSGSLVQLRFHGRQHPLDAFRFVVGHDPGHVGERFEHLEAPAGEVEAVHDRGVGGVVDREGGSHRDGPQGHGLAGSAGADDAEAALDVEAEGERNLGLVVGHVDDADRQRRAVVGGSR